MAQVFKAITFPERVRIGGRQFVVAEIELGTEYLAKGVVVKASDLGLLTISFAIPLSEWESAAEAPEALAPSVVLINPGTTAAELKLQVFGSGAAKKEAAFELADKAATSGFKALFLICGRFE